MPDFKPTAAQRTAARKPIMDATKGAVLTRADLIAAVADKVDAAEPHKREDGARITAYEEINAQLQAGKIEWLGMGRYRKL
jgi:hypothetical protein